MIDCKIISVKRPSEVRVIGLDEQELVARCPQHVSMDWLEAALAVAPVDAVIVAGGGLRPVLWGVFPDADHRVVRSKMCIRVSEIEIDASERVRVSSGSTSLSLKSEGTVVLRGRDVLSRAEENNRLKGGRVRIN